MAVDGNSVVICTYSMRDHADELIAMLWKEGIASDVVPSDRHVGEWDVLVSAHVADRANQIVNALLGSG